MLNSYALLGCAGRKISSVITIGYDKESRFHNAGVGGFYLAPRSAANLERSGKFVRQQRLVSFYLHASTTLLCATSTAYQQEQSSFSGRLLFETTKCRVSSVFAGYWSNSIVMRFAFMDTG